jgi:hypothetical protein
MSFSARTTPYKLFLQLPVCFQELLTRIAEADCTARLQPVAYLPR